MDGLRNHKNRRFWRILFGIIIIIGLAAGSKYFYFSRAASAEILAEPAGAKIKLADFQAIDKLVITKLPASEYQLEVSRPGFKKYSEKVQIKNRKKLVKKISLEPQILNFKFDSNPTKTDFVLTLADGSEKKGTTPFEDKISAGKLKIKLSENNYNNLEQKLFLDRDRSELFFLDPQGQLVHHLLNISPAPSAKGVAITPDNKEIWTTLLLNAKKGVSIFNTLTGENTADINLAGAGGVEVIFSGNGQKAYISQMETAQIFEIDTKTKKILRTFSTNSSWTKIIELSADEKTLFASNWCGDDISEIDLTTGRLRRRIPTVDTPRGLYPTTDGKTLYVAGFGNGEIEKIDLATGKGKIIYNSGGAMRHIVADEERGLLYISDMAKNVIWQLSLKNDQVTKFVNTDRNPNTIAFSPDKKILFVSCRGENASAENYYIPGPEWGSVLLFDTESGQMLDAIVAGNQPTALDISVDGKLLVFSDFLDSRLEVFQIPSYDVLKSGKGGRSQLYKSELKK